MSNWCDSTWCYCDLILVELKNWNGCDWSWCDLGWNENTANTTSRWTGPLFDDSVKTFEKTQFSMVTEDVKRWLDSRPDIDTVILCGLETHVCVNSTVIDLCHAKYNASNFPIVSNILRLNVKKVCITYQCLKKKKR